MSKTQKIVLMRWMYLLFLHQLVITTESLKRGSFLAYFTEVLMQVRYGYYVEQDEYCITNMQNLKVKVTKMSQIGKLLNFKVFKVAQTKADLH